MKPLQLAVLGSLSFEAALLANFYPVVFFTLLVSGLGLPIPEDVTLISAGAVLRLHPEAANRTAMIFAAIAGVLAGDVLMYSIGRRFGPGIVQHRFFSRLVPPKRFRKASLKFQKHGVWLCFVSRFLMGVRSATWLTAGATHYPFWKFILADGAAAFITTPFWLILGWRFAYHLADLYAVLADARGIILAALGVIIGLVILRWLRNARRTSNRQKQRKQARQAAQPAKSFAAES